MINFNLIENGVLAMHLIFSKANTGVSKSKIISLIFFSIKSKLYTCGNGISFKECYLLHIVYEMLRNFMYMQI